MVNKWGEGADSAKELYDLILPEEPWCSYKNLKLPITAEGNLCGGETMVEIGLPSFTRNDFESEISNKEYYERLLTVVSEVLKEVDDCKKSLVVNLRLTDSAGLVVGEGHLEFESLSEMLKNIDDYLD